MTENWKIIRADKIDIFLSKIAIYLSLGRHKGNSSYRRSLPPLKENLQHFKTWNLLIFFYFCRSFLPSWSRIQIHCLIESGSNPDPNTYSNPGLCTLTDSKWRTRVLLGGISFILCTRENHKRFTYISSGSWSRGPVIPWHQARPWRRAVAYPGPTYYRSRRRRPRRHWIRHRRSRVSSFWKSPTSLAAETSYQVGQTYLARSPKKRFTSYM